ncbi:MAG TPA: hypothetical protein VH912_06190 [Streptosporangiaceae bacterium]|jgi:hypothetical protein
MSERAEQLVLEYLGRANDIALRHLGSRERLEFITRLRQRIEEYRTQAGGATEPNQVRKVLAKFGDPEALVMRERRRLDGSVDGADGAGTTPAEAPARPVRRPAAPPATKPGTWQPTRRSRPWSTPRATQESDRRSTGPGSRVRDDADRPPVAEPVVRPARIGRGDEEPSRGGPTAQSPPSAADAGGAVDLDALYRRYPIELGAIVLLAFGGLLPIPLWIFGAAAVLAARAWTAQEKLVGVLALPLVAVVAMVATGDGGALAGLREGDVPLLFRLAGPAAAIYLGWRLLRSIGARSVRFTRGGARP